MKPIIFEDPENADTFATYAEARKEIGRLTADLLIAIDETLTLCKEEGDPDSIARVIRTLDRAASDADQQAKGAWL